MTVKVEEHESTENKGTVHCETCYRTLERKNTGDEALGQEIITILNGVAERHEQRHKTHQITIHLYQPKKLVE